MLLFTFCSLIVTFSFLLLETFKERLQVYLVPLYLMERAKFRGAIAIYTLAAMKPYISTPYCGGKGYFAECGLRNAESSQRVICGKFDADFFLRNEG